MSRLLHDQPITAAEYLAGEETARRKHEYVDGVVYAMVGATNDHNRIATNVAGTLHPQLRGRPCQVFNSDVKVRIRQSRGTRFYYPDASVVCQPNPGRDSFQDRPAVIFEVISESTRRVDEHEKREAYLSINSLAAYILLEQSEPAALLYRRTDDGFVTERYAGFDATIPLPEVGCRLPLAEVYAAVDFTPVPEDIDE